MYKSDRGSLALEFRTGTVHDPLQQRDVAVHVVEPRDGGPYPVVIFSTGAYCPPERYGAVLDHWASHGYVVIAPTHVDVVLGRDNMKPAQLQQMLWSRIDELTLATDAAPTLAGPGKVDTARMAVAGHSLGAMLAEIKAGAWLTEPRTGERISRAEPRFRATLVMSGVGLMPPMAKNSFDGITGPMLANGGTLDGNNNGENAMFSWQWRMSPYRLAPPGDKYAVILDGADHFFGGLMCRDDRGGTPDPDGLAFVRSLQVAFLDAYVKGDRRARRYLTRTDFVALTRQRARFERK